jgi:histone H3/H4
VASLKIGMRDMAERLFKNTTKNIMRTVTKIPISDSAIILLNIKIEQWIKDITKEAEKILKETNEARKVQGLRERKRLSEDEIKEVIE